MKKNIGMVGAALVGLLAGCASVKTADFDQIKLQHPDGYHR